MRSETGIWAGPYLPVTVANLTIVAIAAFDGLAIVAALPNIAEDLGRVGLLPWVITAYLATSAVAIIVAGPIIDAVGVRRTFRVTAVWFLVSSAAAAAAPNLALLIVARVLQGLGGGLVMAVALAAVGLAYPHELRPRAFAANSMVWGVMGFGGPALAGVVLAFGSWRSIFVAQLPVTALAIIVGWNSLPSTRERPTRIKVDWYGVSLLALLTLSSLVALSEIGSNWYVLAVGLIVTLATATIYWRHSGMSSAPVLERVHLVRFPFAGIHLTSGLVLVAAFAADNYLPLYVQTTRGRSESFAAFSLVFMVVGWTAASVFYSRRLSHRREVDVIMLGAWLIVPSTAFADLAIALDAPLGAVFSAFACIGISVGLVSTAGLTLMQASSVESEMGRVNSAHQFVRTLSITYGVAIGGAILLLVVDDKVGNIDSVRDVLAGEEIELGAATEAAIGSGVAWATAFSFAVAVACLVAAIYTQRRVTRLASVELALD